MPNLFAFLQQVCMRKDIQIYMQVTGLIGDLIDCLGQAIAPQLQSNYQWIGQLMQCLQMSNN